MPFNFLQETGFLQALGLAILNSLWQAFILWIIYQIIVSFRKKRNASFRHNLGIAFVLGSFVWFAITFYSGLLQQSDVIPGATLLQSKILIIPDAVQTGFVSNIPSLLPYLSVSYLALIVILLCRLGIRYHSSQKLLYSGLAPVPAFLEKFVLIAAKAAAIPKMPGIWISKHVDVPATLGFLKPVILIPLAAINQLSPVQLEAIVLHEISHIKRHDYLINLLLSVVEILLFFNPFVIFLMKEVRRERENCCDDFVLKERCNSHTYVRALVQLETLRHSQPDLAMGAVSGKNQLLQRIKRITGSSHPTNRFPFRQRLITLLLILAIFISLAFLLPESKGQNTQAVMKQEISLKAHQPSGQSTIANKPKENRNSEKNKSIVRDENATASQPKPNISLNVQTEDLNQAAEAINLISQLSSKGPESKALKSDFLNTQVQTALQEAQKHLSEVNWKDLTRQTQISLEQAQKSLNQIDWEGIEKQIEHSLDSLKINGPDMEKIQLKDWKVQIAKVRENVKNKKQTLLKHQDEQEKLSKSIWY